MDRETRRRIGGRAVSAATVVPQADRRPAGIITRLLAAAIDIAAVCVLTGVAFLSVAAAGLAVSPVTFRWTPPSTTQTVLVWLALAIVYLTTGWATSGRSGGAAVLGLRVLSRGGARLGWFRAALRAALCAVFPVGLLWAAVNRNRHSVQDIVVRSVVVYDWHRAVT